MREGMTPDDAPPSAHRAAADALATLARWYAGAGVTSFTGETARDRFAETAGEAARRRGATAAPAVAVADVQASRAPERRAAPGPDPVRVPAPVVHRPSDDMLAADARRQAAGAETLADLRALLERFDGCLLKATAKSLVFGNGPDRADLMMVGEAPGRDEDIAGEPFVGKSGQFLNRMLASIGVERDAVRITNTVFWRPPGNRTPTPAETETCLPFTLRQIELVRPRVLVCLGAPSTRALLRTEDGIMRLRGRWSELQLPNGSVVPVMPMLHPAYLLRQPAHKRLAWRDLLALRERLGGTPETP